MKLVHANPSTPNNTWPVKTGKDIRILSRWKLKDTAAAGCRIRQGSTGFICAADLAEDEIEVWVNPAIVWVGSYGELKDMWEPVSDDTELTF